MTFKFQSQTSEVARYCVRQKVEETGADDDESDPLHVRMKTAGSAPWGQHTRRDMGDVMDADGDKGNWTQSTGAPRSEDGYRLAAILPPDSPTLTLH